MKNVGFISLGCPKNQLDTEIMLGMLQEAGYTVVAEDQADILVVNTCGFIQEAKEEAIETTLAAARYKETGPCRVLVMAGCFSQRYAADLVRELPEVDFFIGLDDVPHIAQICDRLVALQKQTPEASGGSGTGLSKVSETLRATVPSTYLYGAATPRTPLGARHTAYVKIAEGCRYKCSFCAIPMIRGSLRSREMSSVVQEVTQLLQQGVKEINLIAQDTTSYGVDLIGKPLTVPLLEQLSQISGEHWIRLMYAYPMNLDRALMRVIAQSDTLCSYLDLPLQHIDSAILQAMRRPITETATRELMTQLREEIPGLTLRTSLIVGFPGETEAAFEKLKNFVREVEFDRMGVFTYSPEEGTAAYDLPNRVPPEVAEERRQELMALQSEISLKKHQALVGTIQRVLVDGVSAETPLLLEARTEGQAPEIDGLVYINEGNTEQGAFERILISEAHPYDLIGKIVE